MILRPSFQIFCKTSSFYGTSFVFLPPPVFLMFCVKLHPCMVLRPSFGLKKSPLYMKSGRSAQFSNSKKRNDNLFECTLRKCNLCHDNSYFQQIKIFKIQDPPRKKRKIYETVMIICRTENMHKQGIYIYIYFSRLSLVVTRQILKE